MNNKACNVCDLQNLYHHKQKTCQDCAKRYGYLSKKDGKYKLFGCAPNTKRNNLFAKLRYREHRRHIGKWLECEKCSWVATNKCQLDINHKDGDRFNNNQNNLEMICRNCHALETTIKKHFKNRYATKGETNATK